MLMAGASAPWMIAAICLLGFSIGAEVDFTSYLISRYVGLRSFTSALGLLMAVFNTGASAGPFLMGYSAIATGMYDFGLRILLGLLALALVPFLALDRYPDNVN